MQEEELKTITDNIQEKIGKESSGFIADDIGKLITGNQNNLSLIRKKDEEIKSLKETNEKLVLANGSLLAQIPVASEYDKHPSEKEETEKPSFSLRSVFDSKGNFKRIM